MSLPERTRASLAAIAEVSLPAGARLPAGGDATVGVLERSLAELPPGATAALTGLVAAADLLALRHGSRSLASLQARRRFALLERWRTAPAYPARLAFRALMTALKAAHAATPEVLARAGVRAPAEPPAIEPEPRWSSQVTDLGNGYGTEEVEADVVVIGSGAGGAAAARTLAEAGLGVAIVERGALHRRRDLVGSALSRTARLYDLWGVQATVGNVSILLPTGSSVGGTTTINSGTCFRLPPWVLRAWREHHGVPVADGELDPWYDRVERWLEVDLPDPRTLGAQAAIIARGAEALGLRHGPLLRNAPGCDAQAMCCFGCPSGAKRSADVALVPAALTAGAALFTRAIVDSIEPGSPIRVRARGAGGRTLTVVARAAILAAGTLRTPGLLRAAGVRHPWVGRNLSIHPATGAVGVFPFEVGMDMSVPQGYGVHELAERGLLFEGAGTPFDVTAITLSGHGPRYVELLESYGRLLTYGFNLRESSRGRVARGPGGRPVPLYQLGVADVSRIEAGLRVLVDLLVAGGASSVVSPVAGLDEIPAAMGSRALDGRAVRASDLQLSAYHPLGTARMGVDPARSVVDMDLRVRGVDGLLVCDGSVIPNSIGVNPQLTIMALASRAAERLADALA